MPPRHELNARFQTYLKRDQLQRRLAVFVLGTCLLVGTGAAAAKLSPNPIAGATAALSNVASAAGSGTSSALDAFANFLGTILHPDTIATSATPPVHWGAQSPQSASPPSRPDLQATSTQALPSIQSSAEMPSSSTRTTLSESSRTYSGKVLGASATTITLPPPVQIPNDLVRAYTLAVLLASFQWDVNQKFAALENPPPFPQQVAAGGTTVIYQSANPAAQRIDRLDNVVINNPTIIGGSISGTSGAGGGGIGSDATTTTFFSTIGHFTTGIIDALSSAAATITNLTTTELIATNATSTNFAATNASTTNLTTGSLTLGSGTGVLYAAGGSVSAIVNSSDGKVLKLSGGVPTWGNDNTGSGGGSSIWATTTDSLAASLSPASIVLLVGASATTTTGNILEVKGNSLFRGTATAYNTITAPSFTATSTTVASQLPYASSTGFSASYASSTSGFFGTLSIGNLTGFLKATAGAISTALVDLASNVTGTLPVGNGGTGSTTLSGILKGNGTSQVASAVGGTDYEFPLTFNAPLSRSTNAISLSTSGDWSGTLGGFTATQLIALGFSTTSADVWKSNRNFFATTSVDYYTSVTNFFSTSSADYLASQRSYFSTTSSDFFVSQRNLFSTTSTNYWKTVTDLFSTTSAIAFVHSSTTIPKTYTNNTFLGTQTFSNASTTNISSSYASSTSGFFGSLSIGSLSGFLKATAGVISAALVDLASNVTGILPVTNGGTGWSNVASAAILYGSGTSALATTTSGLPGQVLALLNGVPTWTSTTTLSTISGTLGVGNGGTGAATFSYGLLLSPGGTAALTNIATSSLGLLTTNVAEGSSLYWTNARFDTRLAATTTLPNITTLANLSLPATQLTSFGIPFFSFFSATTTDALAQGSSNKYYADTLVNSFMHASTTLVKTYSSNTFTGSNIFSGSLTLTGLNGPLDARNGVVGATTSVAVLYGGTGATTAAGARTNLAAAASGANTDITSLFALTNASTSLFSVLDTLYVGRTATTTIRGDGVASTIPYASSTALTVSGTGYFGTASSTTLITSGVPGCTEALETNAAGQIICGTDATGSGGGGSDFTFPTHFGSMVAATTTLAIKAEAGLFASSTVRFGNAGISPFFYDGAVGNVGIGTTTPWAQLSVNAAAGTNSIAIGSSTATYFLVNSSGRVGVGTTTPGSIFSIQSIANFQSGTSTIYDNLNVQGQLKVGTGSIYLNGSATSTFSAGMQLSKLSLTNALSLVDGGTGATTAANARTNLGVTATGGDTTYAFRSNNLSDLGNAGTARSNLGLGTMATQNTGSTGTNSAQNIDSGCGTNLTGSLGFTNGIVTSSSNFTYNLGISGCDGDIAERYGTEELVVRGEIVALGTTVTSREFNVLNPTSEEATTTKYTIATANVRKATFARRDKLIGGVPTSPQILGGDVIDPNDHPQLVALVGHVPTKMTLDGGGVAIGDPITVSSTTPGYGMKAVTSGRILGWALENFSETATSSDGMIEVYVNPQDWIAPQDFNALLDLSQITAASTDSTSFTTRFFSSLFTRLAEWFADATNGITDFFAKVGHFNKVCAKNSDGTETCVTGDELKSLLAGPAAAGAAVHEDTGAPSGSPAVETANADTATTTTPANDNEPLAATTTSEISEPSQDVPPAVQPTDTPIEPTAPIIDPAPVSEPANDNDPPVELPATGTE